MREVSFIPLFPGRRFGLERRLSGGDAFQVDGAHRLPIGRPKSINEDQRRVGHHTFFSLPKSQLLVNIFIGI